MQVIFNSSIHTYKRRKLAVTEPVSLVKSVSLVSSCFTIMGAVATKAALSLEISAAAPLDSSVTLTSTASVAPEVAIVCSLSGLLVCLFTNPSKKEKKYYLRVIKRLLHTLHTYIHNNITFPPLCPRSPNNFRTVLFPQDSRDRSRYTPGHCMYVCM